MCASHITSWMENDGDDQSNHHSIQSNLFQNNRWLSVSLCRSMFDEEANDGGMNNGKDKQHYCRSLRIRINE